MRTMPAAKDTTLLKALADNMTLRTEIRLLLTEIDADIASTMPSTTTDLLVERRKRLAEQLAEVTDSIDMLNAELMEAVNA